MTRIIDTCMRCMCRICTVDKCDVTGSNTGDLVRNDHSVLRYLFIVIYLFFMISFVSCFMSF